jgi:hypothetical protein
MAHMVWYWAGPDAYIDAAAGEAAGDRRLPVPEGRARLRRRHRGAYQRRCAGLIGAFLIGKRVGYGRESMAPHSLTFTMIGASLLWFGWFGFNAGSALEAKRRFGSGDGQHLGGNGLRGDVLDAGRMAAQGQALDAGRLPARWPGLVAITPAAGFVGVMGAIVIGLLAGVVCLWGVNGLKRMLGADDSLDVFGVHGVGGILGAILTGVFCDPALGGTGVYDYVANAVGEYDMAGAGHQPALGACGTSSGRASFQSWPTSWSTCSSACVCRKRKSAKVWTSPRTANRPTTTKAEHHGLVAVHQHAVFEVVAQAAREHGLLDVLAVAHHVLDRVGVVDADHVLLDDRALVEFARSRSGRSRRSA